MRFNVVGNQWHTISHEHVMHKLKLTLMNIETAVFVRTKILKDTCTLKLVSLVPQKMTKYQ